MSANPARRPIGTAWAARLLVLMLVPVGVLLGVSAPAQAHPALVTSSPGAGYAVTSAPGEIVLMFNETVSLPDRPLTVRDAGGGERMLRLELDPDGTSLRGVPAAELPVGAYEVSYRVVGRDGDLINGTFTFGVATPVGTVSGASGGAGDPQRVQGLTAAFRGLLFLGLALGLGGAYLAWRVDEATGGLPGARPLLRTGSLLGLAGATGLLAGLGPAAELLERVSAPGIAQLLAAEAVLLSVAALSARRPARGALAAASLVGVVLLEAARAHPGEAFGAAGAALTVVHLLAGALWLGGLVQALRLTAGWRTTKPRAVRVAVETYVRNAVVLLVLVAVTGTVSAVTLLPSLADWTGTTYGRTLLVKLALFALVLTAALFFRTRVRRVHRQDHPPAPPDTAAPAAPVPAHGPRHWARPAGVEAAMLAAVVLVAAAVTSVTPARLVPVSSLLAAPIGPTLRVADRVRQVSVSIVASQGRLEVRADAPDDGEPLTIEVTGQVRPTDGVERPLMLTSCGESCWTGPVEWATGVNTVSLDVDAQRWPAGRLSLPVSWPPVPAAGLLARVQSAMGARPAIDTVETVTSGFGVVLPSSSRRTGQEFLESQPWIEGGATDAVLLDEEAQRTLLFALPALGYHFAMRLNPQDRVISERIVTPNHLLTREYQYPPG